METNVLEFTKEFGLIESFPFGKHYSGIKDKVMNYILLKILIFKMESGISKMKKFLSEIQYLPINQVNLEYSHLKDAITPIKKVESVFAAIKPTNSDEQKLVDTSVELLQLTTQYIQILEKTHKTDLEVLEKLKAAQTGKFYSYDEVFN